MLDLICGHPDVDAIVHLGIGIQAASASNLKSGEFYPDYGLERIVAFHERQDRRYAEAARECSERQEKPILSCTELVHTDMLRENPGPAGIREEGRICYASAHRAVRALRALIDYIGVSRHRPLNRGLAAGGSSQRPPSFSRSA